MNKPKSIEEWRQIIETARNSGLSDKDWCMENNVSLNTFYYNVRRLRVHACDVPASVEKRITPAQTVVPLEIVDDDVYRIHSNVETTVISINCNGLEISISNSASPDIIKAVVDAAKG